MYLQLNSLPQVTKILFAITIWISYALQGYVTADILWNKYLVKKVKDTSKHLPLELSLRFSIVLLSCRLLCGLVFISVYLYLV